MSRKSKFWDLLTIAVAGGDTVRAAAANVGCAPSTAYRICSGDDFKRRVGELRTECTDSAVGRLSRLATTAVGVLESIMQDANQPAAARVTAAKTSLQMLGPLSELLELRARLDALEANQLRVVA